jgi:hypothetical protein
MKGVIPGKVWANVLGQVPNVSRFVPRRSVFGFYKYRYALALTASFSSQRAKLYH